MTAPAPEFSISEKLMRLSLTMLILAASLGSRAHADIGLSAEVGRGEQVDIWGLGLRWSDLHVWHLTQTLDLGLAILGRVDHWHGEETKAVVTDLWDISATPVLRLQPSDHTGVTAFLDVGIGVSLITHTRINAHRILSTAFQFNELIGPGVRFGGRAQFELALRVQHTSNDSIKEPNNGLTFRTIVFQYTF